MKSDLLEMAHKKRHLYLMKRVLDGEVLTKQEINELTKYERMKKKKERKKNG